jgi:hypothetical protein
MNAVTHIAGPALGDVQRCVRCRTIIVDNRNTFTMGGPPMFFAEGGRVSVIEGNPRVTSSIADGEEPEERERRGGERGALLGEVGRREEDDAQLALAALGREDVEVRDAAVREYLAAVDALDSARRSYLSATIGSESVTTGENVRRHDAMVAAEARVREAEHRFRAIVEGDG